MEDLYGGDEVRLWQKVESTARNIFEKAGFQEIRTPIVEDANLFERSVGETTDIVEKEMYILFDRNEKRLALRPEGTASIVRAFIEHYTQHNVLEGRFYYMGPMFRYERPQKGRYRQFYQIGAENFGSDHPLADAEMISLVDQLFRELQLDNLELQVNSLGMRDCRSKYRDALKTYLEKVQGGFDEAVQKRIQKNPLRVLDSKDKKVQAALQDAPIIMDYLSDESRKHFDQVQSALNKLEIPFKVNPRIVRGLDYYEKTVFEFVSSGLGAQNAVAAGGRYNDLVSDLGGPSVPAVGFALGMERLVSVLPKEKLREENPPKVYFIGLDNASNELFFPLMKEVREAGAIVQMDMSDSSLKSKMRRASKWGADLVMISGEEEFKKGVAILRSMQDSAQEEVPVDEILSKLLSKFPTKHFFL